MKIKEFISNKIKEFVEDPIYVAIEIGGYIIIFCMGIWLLKSLIMIGVYNAID